VRRTAPSVNLGAPHILETVRARKLKFYTPLKRDISTFGNDNFSARGVCGGAAPVLSIGDPLISGKQLELES